MRQFGAILFGAFFIWFSVGASANEAAAPSIQVSGSCVRSVQPDLVEVTVAAKMRNADAQKAAELSAPIYDKAMKTIKALNLKNLEIVTNDLGVTRLTAYERDRQVDKGFEANYAFSVITSDINRVGEIFKVAKNSGANEVVGPRFRLSKSLRKKEYELCLDEASKNARAKAEAIAKSLGVELSAKLIVQENSAGGPMVYAEMASAAESFKSTAAPAVESKKEDVQVSLSATFFIK